MPTNHENPARNPDQNLLRGQIERVIDRLREHNSRLKDVAELKRLVGANPEAVPDRLKDFAAFAATTLTSDDKATGFEPIIRARFDSLRRELGYDTSSVVERLLIDQVALCYLRLNLWEQRHASLSFNQYSLRLGHFWERRLSAAQSRYLRAVEVLVRVRRLLSRPPTRPVHFNIAAKQAAIAIG